MKLCNNWIHCYITINKYPGIYGNYIYFVYHTHTSQFVDDTAFNHKTSAATDLYLSINVMTVKSITSLISHQVEHPNYFHVVMPLHYNSQA